VTPQQSAFVRSACVIAGLLGIVMSVGCSETGNIDVSSRYGAGVKLAGLGSTFAWAPAPADPPGTSPAAAQFRQAFRDNVEKALVAKGFALNQAGPANFLVDCRIGMREKTDSSVNPHGEVFEEGSLVLDVLNPSSKALIWRSVAQARVLREIPHDVREKRINMAVQRMMKDFPPK
jgi:hypothetical protein